MAAASALGLAVLAAPRAAQADTITFRNGDRLTGTIVEMLDGKIRFKSAAAGEVLIDTVDVATFSTDGLIDLQLADGTVVKQQVEAGPEGRITVTGADGAQEYEISSLKSLNPRTTWRGNVRAGLLLNRGNTDNDNYYAAFDITRRSELDRWTFNGQYNLVRTEDSDGDKTSTTDNWRVGGKYDYFFNDRLYGFAALMVERDRIANLDYRISPSVGLGYQWHESPEWNFSTEAGVAYVYEKYREPSDASPDFDDDDSFVALRFGYHYDRKLNDKVLLFHNLEYLPGLDDIDNYRINGDIGLRASLSTNWFAEARMEMRHDNSPPEDAVKTDLRYVIALGWQF
jgi:putative salt-induced outer membrane protein YdiY